ncbi:hypothetical protein [psittacine adenovirus 6]|uniref:Uncharacterized protein n=1 Tax=psittacine adenovirus 6 TaxID=3071234 RepID=A0AAE6X431_9ADEN|nr:hypothetical protein [psittacine adenovirus 6]
MDPNDIDRMETDNTGTAPLPHADINYQPRDNDDDYTSRINLEASSSDYIPDSEESEPEQAQDDSDNDLCVYYICTSGIVDGLPPGLQRNVLSFCCNTACVVFAVHDEPCVIQTHCHCGERVHTLFCVAWQRYASKVSHGFFI